ncbi:MAG: prolyl oligopeptidase family serine peptidase [Pseudomonadota bacterium]
MTKQLWTHKHTLLFKPFALLGGPFRGRRDCFQLLKALVLSVLLGGWGNSASASDQSAAAVPPLYPAKSFAELPMVMQPKLSPDGKSVAYITSAVDGRKGAVAHPINGKTKSNTIYMPHLDKADVLWVAWANNDVLLVAYSFFAPNPFYQGAQVEQTRLLAASLKDGAYNLVKASRKQKLKTRDENPVPRKNQSIAANQTDIVDFLRDDPEHILLATDSDVTGRIDVRKINVRTGKYKIVQKGRNGIYEWLTDSENEIALGYSVFDDKPKLFISKKHEKTWSYDAIYALLAQDFIPIWLYAEDATGVFYAENAFGRRSFARYDLITGKLIETFYSHAQYDASILSRNTANGDIIGSGYVDTQQRQIFFKNPERKMLAAVDTVFTNASNRLYNSDDTRQTWLLSTSKAGVPKKYYRLDWSIRELLPFAKEYPDLDDTHLAAPTMRKITMRDGLEIEVYITLPLGRGNRNLPAVLVPHGGPWARDDAGFDAQAQFFANRGYVVLQPNFRGSAGYGKKFEDLGIGQWGKAMQDDLTDTVSWAVKERLVDPKRVCIVGGSYGGYAAMMGVVKTPDQFQCAISINGVIDIPRLWRDDRKYLFYKRFREKLGSPASDLSKISPFHRANEITKPVLLIAAKDDWRVNYKHSSSMYKKLKTLKKPVEYLELKTGGHGIDVDANRIKWFKAMDAFLAKHLGQSTDG